MYIFCCAEHYDKSPNAVQQHEDWIASLSMNLVLVVFCADHYSFESSFTNRRTSPLWVRTLLAWSIATARRAVNGDRYLVQINYNTQPLCHEEAYRKYLKLVIRERKLEYCLRKPQTARTSRHRRALKDQGNQHKLQQRQQQQ
jgi:hypothetical protein